MTPRWLSRLRGALDSTLDGTFLAPLRVVVGLGLALDGAVRARELATVGYFGGAFHVPLLPERLVPSKGIYAALVAARLVLALLVVVGARARIALALSSALAIHALLADTVGLDDARYLLAVTAGLLALTPCEPRTSIVAEDDAPPAPPSIGFGYGVFLIRVEVMLLHAAFALAWLRDADARSGAVLREHLLRVASTGGTFVLSPGALTALAERPVVSVVAKGMIVASLAVAGLALGGRTRIPAVAAAVVLRACLLAVGHAPAFSLLAAAMLVAFAKGDTKARALRFDPASSLGRAVAAIVRATDWLGRYSVSPWAVDGLTSRHTLVIVRRDGSRATGLAAAAMLTRTIPLFFPAWPLVAFVASFTKGGDVTNEA
jgi:hypothetical protein